LTSKQLIMRAYAKRHDVWSKTPITELLSNIIPWFVEDSCSYSLLVRLKMLNLFIIGTSIKLYIIKWCTLLARDTATVPANFS
jgi:hypothetical protein